MPTSIRKSRSTAGPLTEAKRELLHAVGWQVQMRSGSWNPPTDVYETSETFVVRVEIAGLEEEDFEIVIENNLLFISGIRSEQPERRAYQQMEIRFGKFETVVGLPGPVDLESARADYSEGFLTVHIPKAKSAHVDIQED